MPLGSRYGADRRRAVASRFELRIEHCGMADAARLDNRSANDGLDAWPLSVGQRHQQIERLQGLTRVGVAESALEDASYFAIAINVAESPIDPQPEILVATRQRQCI